MLKNYKVFHFLTSVDSPLKEDVIIFRFELLHFFRAHFKININIIGHISVRPSPSMTPDQSLSRGGSGGGCYTESLRGHIRAGSDMI